MQSRKKEGSTGAIDKAQNCPCGSNRTYQTCCGVLHQGGNAESAEALMRSRYSAFVLEDEAYLKTSWHSTTRPESIPFDEDTKWLRLIVREHYQGESENEAFVRYEARYSIHGKAYKLIELSRFLIEEGAWRYVDGEIFDV